MVYRAPAGMNLKQPVIDPRLATALSTATGMQWSASPLCPGREGAQTTHAGHSVRVYRDPAGWAILVSSRLGWTNDARRRVTGFAGRGWRERLASHVAECFQALKSEVVQ